MDLAQTTEVLGNWLCEDQARFLNIRVEKGDVICNYHLTSREKAAEVPEPLKQGVTMLLMVGDLFYWLKADNSRRMRLRVRKGLARTRVMLVLMESGFNDKGEQRRLTYIGRGDTITDAVGSAVEEYERRPGRQGWIPKAPPVVLQETHHKNEQEHHG